MNKYWIVLIIGIIIAAFAQIFLKKAAMKKYGSVIREYLNLYVVLGYFLMFASTICTILAYRGLEYKNGPVLESLGYFLILFLSWLFFKEKVTKKKLLGNILIVLGIIVFYL